MKTHLVVSLLIAMAGCVGTLKWWTDLRTVNDERVAQIAEAESYAARSELAWDMETLLSALGNVHAFWSSYANLPRSEWPSPDTLRLDQFDGMELLIWSDPKNGIRFAYTPDNDQFDYRPNDEEWSQYDWLLSIASQQQQNILLDPVPGNSGRVFVHVVVVGSAARSSGRLIAAIDAQHALDRFLADQSPGFAIQVESKGTLLYRRQDPDEAAPPQWVRSGKITTTFGGLWTVTHTPTAAWVESYSVAEIDLILVMGLTLSVIFAALYFENRRSSSRANIAEAAEREITEINRRLESQVLERTRELAARTADLQTLAESVGHDLRGPLNALSVNVQLLQAEFADQFGDRGDEILGRFAPSIRHMSEILERLAGLSKLSYLTFERTEFSMRALATEVFEDLSASEPPPPARFEVGELPPTNADKTFVRLLLTNLIGNALKYTRNNDQRLIRMRAETINGEVVYSVSDNGVGFDDAVAGQLFAAFKRFDDDNDGLGLGLTLVKKVVSRHEGWISASGSPGNGATFRFTLQAMTR